MAALLIDEDFPHPTAGILAQLGHDVVTIQDLRQRGAADPGVMALAATERRSVVTHN